MTAPSLEIKRLKERVKALEEEREIDHLSIEQLEESLKEEEFCSSVLLEEIEKLKNALRPFAEAGSSSWERDPNRILLITTKGQIKWDDLIRANEVMKDEMD